MKKVLFITCYWPPAGGGGVQRGVKFCKYLRDFGWEPVILTVQDGYAAQIDPSLERDVRGDMRIYRTPILEPHKLFNRIKRPETRGAEKLVLDKSHARRARWIQTIGNYIRLNLFIPDARIGWLHYAVREGRKIMRDESPDAIISTSPPYTAHRIARRLQRAFHRPWIADFRDPWVENIQYNDVPRLGIVKALNRRMERETLQHADRVITVGRHIGRLLQSKLPPDRRNKVAVITNGYDTDDVREVAPPENADVFYLSYYGTIYGNGFIPDLFEGIRRTAQRHPAFAERYRLKLTGAIPPERRDLIIDRIPPEKIDARNYIPHDDALRELYQPQVLLMTINRVPHNELIITGKIFDYLPTGNPILAVGPPDSDAAPILKDSGAGHMFDYGDYDGMERFLMEQFDAWKKGTLNRGPRHIPAYDRKNLTAQLAAVLDGLG